jgi:hypothetical protein
MEERRRRQLGHRQATVEPGPHLRGHDHRYAGKQKCGEVPAKPARRGFGAHQHHELDAAAAGLFRHVRRSETGAVHRFPGRQGVLAQLAADLAGDVGRANHERLRPRPATEPGRHEPARSRRAGGPRHDRDQQQTPAEAPARDDVRRGHQRASPHHRYRDPRRHLGLRRRRRFISAATASAQTR